MFPVFLRFTVLVAFALCLALPFSAQAADKLIVKDSGGTNTVFRVDEFGTVEVPNGFKWDNSLKRMGIATTDPQGSLHIVDTISGTRGLVTAQHSTDNQAAVMIFRKTRGTEAIPTALTTGDYIATFHAQGYDGSVYQVPASTTFTVDGAVSSGSVPTAWAILTGLSASARSERIRVTSAGNVGIGTSTPTQLLDVNSNGIRIRSANTPASSTAACNQGEISWSASYIYVCVATNSWKRATLSAW